MSKIPTKNKSANIQKLNVTVNMPVRQKENTIGLDRIKEKVDEHGDSNRSYRVSENSNSDREIKNGSKNM